MLLLLVASNAQRFFLSSSLVNSACIRDRRFVYCYIHPSIHPSRWSSSVLPINSGMRCHGGGTKAPQQTVCKQKAAAEAHNKKNPCGSCMLSIGASVRKDSGLVQSEERLHVGVAPCASSVLFRLLREVVAPPSDTHWPTLWLMATFHPKRKYCSKKLPDLSEIRKYIMSLEKNIKWTMACSNTSTRASFFACETTRYITPHCRFRWILRSLAGWGNASVG